MLSVASVLFWFTDYTISVFIMMQTTKEVPLTGKVRKVDAV